MENVLFGFVKVLEPYDAKTITTSFNRWMTSKSNMPTPADIATECAEIVAYAPKPVTARPIALPPPSPKAVPWCGKKWDELDERVKSQLREHMKKLGPKAEDYSKYLINTMGYPTGFAA